MAGERLFQSFFMGGFECSSHRARSRLRLDMLAATQHDRYAAADYARLRARGIRTVREGLRWHLVEPAPGRYDFSSALPILRAARDTGVQVIWDLCHYGWPDDIDIFAPEFVRRFERMAGAFARLLADETDAIPFVAPMNEISFLSWVAGEVGWFYPFAEGRGYDLKRQLVRAVIAGIESIWAVLPGARIVHPDPAINVIADPAGSHERADAERLRIAQYQAWDMLCGRADPDLGGQRRYLDIVGVNYYPHNQWIHGGATIEHTHPLYRPFSQILREIYERYGRPLFVAETSSLGDVRPGWLRYVGREVRAALRAGVPIGGVCLYPIVSFPDWEDDRRSHCGLWSYPDAAGERAICRPLARELRRQQRLVAQVLWGTTGRGIRPGVRRAARRKGGISRLGIHDER